MPKEVVVCPFLKAFEKTQILICNVKVMMPEN